MPEQKLDPNLIFIKLGGSLITDKDQTETAKLGIILELLSAIQRQLIQQPELKLVLGHGSGSFGHHAAKKHNTRSGVFNTKEWLGYQAVWQSARKLNQIVIGQSEIIGLPVLSFPPSAGVVTSKHAITQWNITPIRSALDHGLIPLIYGDVVSDDEIGGTILSTEDLFYYLALQLHPSRILLAGVEAGVFADYPQNVRIINHIPADTILKTRLEGSASVDVTGGMNSKVSLMQSICRAVPGIQIRIFSGTDPENLGKAIQGLPVGTLIQ